VYEAPRDDGIKAGRPRMTYLDYAIHRGARDVPVRETEGLHTVLDKRGSLGRAVSDARVFHENWP